MAISEVFAVKFKRMDTQQRELFKNSGVVLCMRVFGVGFTFLFTMLVARMLDMQSAGRFFLSLGIVSFLTTIGQMGLGGPAIRLAASLKAIGGWPAINNIFIRSIGLAFTVSLLLSILLIGGADWVCEYVFKDEQLAGPLVWITVSIVPIAILSLISEFLKGLKYFIESQLITEIIFRSLSMVGIFLMADFAGLIGAAWAYDFAAVTALLTAIIIWRKKRVNTEKNIKFQYPIKKLVVSGFPILLAQSINLFLRWLPIFLLGIWSSHADVALYNVAFRTAFLPAIILTSINSIAAPKFATIYSNGDIEGLEELAINTTKMMILFAVPLFIVILIFSSQIMKLFGAEYSLGAMVLIIIVGGQIINTACGPVGALLTMCGFEKSLGHISAIGLAVIIPLFAILIPRYGAIGAAIANTIGIVIRNGVGIFLVHSKIRINISPLHLIMHLKN